MRLERILRAVRAFRQASLRSSLGYSFFCLNAAAFLLVSSPCTPEQAAQHDALGRMGWWDHTVLVGGRMYTFSGTAGMLFHTVNMPAFLLPIPALLILHYLGSYISPYVISFLMLAVVASTSFIQWQVLGTLCERFLHRTRPDGHSVLIAFLYGGAVAVSSSLLNLVALVASGPAIGQGERFDILALTWILFQPCFFVAGLVSMSLYPVYRTRQTWLATLAVFLGNVAVAAGLVGGLAVWWSGTHVMTS